MFSGAGPLPDAACPCRSASRGTGSTSRRSRPTGRAARSRDACTRPPSRATVPGPGRHALGSVAGASAGRLALRAIGSLSAESSTALPSSISLGRALTHEDRLAAPLGGDRLTGRDLADVHVHLRERERGGVGVHLIDERPDRRDGADDAGRPRRDVKEVPASGFAAVIDAHGEMRSFRVGAPNRRPASVPSRPRGAHRAPERPRPPLEPFRPRFLSAHLELVQTVAAVRAVMSLG